MTVKAPTRARAKRPAKTGSNPSVSVEEQRFAAMLSDAIGRVATDVDLSEGDVRSMVARLVAAGLLQEQKAPEARRRLAQALGPSLADVDPVPRATVEQARRL